MPYKSRICALIHKTQNMDLKSDFSEEDLKQAMLDKPKRLLEYAEGDPLYALKEIFKPEDLFISEELNYWLIIGLSSDLYAYDDWGKRLLLVFLYDQLLLLVEALYILNFRNIDRFDKKEKIHAYEIHLLSKEQIANPRKVLIAFFKLFSIDYLMREMEDWFKAGLTYPATLPKSIYGPYHIYRIYRNLQCLIKSAERLIQLGHAYSINWTAQNP